MRPKREYKAKSKVKPFSNPIFINRSQINKTFGGDRPESISSFFFYKILDPFFRQLFSQTALLSDASRPPLPPDFKILLTDFQIRID